MCIQVLCIVDHMCLIMLKPSDLILKDTTTSIKFQWLQFIFLFLGVCLDPLKLLRFTFTFQLFFFFFFVKLKCYCSSLLWTVVVTFDREQCIYALFMDPQITLFSNFFIKNGSHGTIYTFKNYFATVFSVFNFQFQQNKFYSNRPVDIFILT